MENKKKRRQHWKKIKRIGLNKRKFDVVVNYRFKQLAVCFLLLLLANYLSLLQTTNNSLYINQTSVMAREKKRGKGCTRIISSFSYTIHGRRHVDGRLISHKFIYSYLRLLFLRSSSATKQISTVKYQQLFASAAN